MIIALSGFIGSGKDVFSDYLEKNYGFEVIIMGDIIRELAKNLGRRPERETLQKLQREYRQKYGKDFFGKEVAKKILKIKSKKVVVNGVRMLGDFEPLKTKFKNVVFVWIETKEKIRFVRLKKRKTARDPKKFDEFKKQEKNELKLFEYQKLKKLADYEIENNLGLEEFYRRIDRIIKVSKIRS